MIHLPPLPGSPGFAGGGSGNGAGGFIEHALRDARTLADAGFRYAMVENFGDAPFAADCVAPETVAAMALVVYEVRRATGLSVGVNCLRNDARSALGVAASAGADYIRVNVHSGMAATDQGMITGKADQTVRARSRICPQVRIFADVHVKHAVPINQPDIALAAEETAYRGKADAIIVSGSSTGRPVDLAALTQVKQAVPDKLVLVGSGATADSIGALLDACDGAIVGSSLKPGGDIAAAIDATLAKRFMQAVGA
ncbi:MAG: BtpA/SgcQ family protein [Phycisphaerales bacterium]|nr:BtpA/SgcQ family protein [Phycisphaerales bacterium]